MRASFCSWPRPAIRLDAVALAANGAKIGGDVCSAHSSGFDMIHCLRRVVAYPAPMTIELRALPRAWDAMLGEIIGPMVWDSAPTDKRPRTLLETVENVVDAVLHSARSSAYKGHSVKLAYQAVTIRTAAVLHPR